MEEFIKEYKNEIKLLNNYIEEHKLNKKDLIMILHKAQEIFGYLPELLQTFIAEKLNIPVSKVYGIVTFYSHFITEKKGDCIINICMGTPCFVRGADKILAEFESILGIKSGSTTADGKFTIDSLRCIGACGLAPVVIVNDEVYGKVTTEQVKEIIEKHRG